MRLLFSYLPLYVTKSADRTVVRVESKEDNVITCISVFFVFINNYFAYKEDEGQRPPKCRLVLQKGCNSSNEHDHSCLCPNPATDDTFSNNCPHLGHHI